LFGEIVTSLKVSFYVDWSNPILVVTTVTALGVAHIVRSKIMSKSASWNPPEFLTTGKSEKIIRLLADSIDNLSDDSLVKIGRQLEFWSKEPLSEEEMVDLTQRLIQAATWRTRNHSFQVPKVRYGRTELQMPVITCGTMRFQHTWAPDFLPVTISKKKVLKTPSQANLVDIVRQCLKLGINHFETARFYGTSEIQLTDALAKLVESGEFKRSDFILQTKLPASLDQKSFKKLFNQSWNHFEKLGYIDLLSFWCVDKHEKADWILSDEEEGIMAAALQWKKEGKIKHIGFSTHASADVIMRLIVSNKFDFVNLHYHFFGSYHAEGTPDTQGGHGNLACVQKALELDMGVFCISPVDKGGRLYQPSSTVARLVGPKLTPISFAALHVLETAGMHTMSVGFARPEDLDEILAAVDLFTRIKENKTLLASAEFRLNKHAEEKLGKDWMEKGMLNIPSCFEESTNGIALGHILWCHNMLHAHGMYETARQRYTKLEETAWNTRKSFEENAKKMPSGNPGRSYDSSSDLGDAFQNHFDCPSAIRRIKETHEILTKAAMTMSDSDRTKMGWDEAYDLRPWHEFPDTDRISISGVLLQNISFGFLGAGGGPTKDSLRNGSLLREHIMQHSTSDS